MKLKETFKRFWTLSSNRKGFTLVELIVVIAILAILAGVAIPVYNGYIKKAQEAADNQLMDSIETAFAAACIANGYNHTEAFGKLEIKDDGTILKTGTRPTAAAYIPGSTYYFDVITVTGVATDPTIVIEEAFAMFFAGNETAAFKGEKYVGKTITVTGADEDGSTVMSEAYNQLLNHLLQNNGADIEAFKNSFYYTLGNDVVLGKVDHVSDVAAALLQEFGAGSAFTDMIAGPEAGAALAANLGFDMSTQDGQDKFVQAMEDLVKSKSEQLIANNPDKYAGQTPGDDTTQLYNDALNSIYANNAIMNAAANTNAVKNDILDILGSEDSSSKLSASVEGDVNKGLAHVALSYGLYTAYAERNGLTVSDNPFEVLGALETEGFKEYAKGADAQADLEGYVASMNILNSSVNNSGEAVEDILINGFANDDLLALLQGLTK